MLQSKSRTWVEIDLNRVKHNTQIINQLIGKTKIMAVVKANAYGHGDVEIAKVLQDDMKIDFFAVSSVDEAVRLREHGINQDILILGYTPSEHFHFLHEYSLTQCLMSLEYANKLDKYAQINACTINAHLKIDTGMGRLGIPCIDKHYCIDEVLAVYALKHIQLTGIFSHFSVADLLECKDDIKYTKHQIELFECVLKAIKEAGYNYGITHIQNSYGCLNYFDLSYDYARPGIILLGATSDDALSIRKEVDLLPALTWKANVSLVKHVKKGQYLGYGRNYRAKRDMKVATLSVGYADGLNRNASHQHAHVLIHGRRCEIIGNICMDQCLVNVSRVENLKEGDVATIVGEDHGAEIRIDELSRCANTINNESFTLISSRVPRFYKR